MAGINSTVRITDGMSKALRSMNKALTMVINSFDSLQDLSSNPIDTANIEEARHALEQSAHTIMMFEEEMEQAGEEAKNTNKEVKNIDSSMSNLVKKARLLLASFMSIRALGSVVELSDKLSQTSARMNLIIDSDAGETVEDLQKRIMDSANRSRASYLDTANAVTSFAQRAGDAFDHDTNQVIAFTEILNKMYAIAGATAEEQSSSMLQLTQALGSGVLRGEEFNAVFEAAPNIMQAVADYMEVPIGALREMSSEGQITAEVVKNAIFNAAEQVNQDFEGMNMTWKQVINQFKNDALLAFEPVLIKINELANNQKVKKFFKSLSNVLVAVANMALFIFGIITDVTSFIYDNWGALEPLIIGIATAITMAGSAWLAYKTYTTVATIAQRALNAVMNANPIFFIISVIILLISILTAWIAKIGSVKLAWLIMCDALYTALECVALGITVIATGIVNVFITMINAIIDAINMIPMVDVETLGHVTWDEDVMEWGSENQRERQEEIEKIRAEIAERTDGTSSAMDEITSFADYMSDIPDIADDTKKISDSLEITDEDLKYLKDLAEKEAINRFTTAEIRIEMQNNNSISSDVDIDGIVNSLEERLYESMTIAAEGAY